MPTPTHTLWICDSARPQIHGRGCCNDRGSERLLEHFAAALERKGLSDRIAVIPSSCMANCPMGISVKVTPGRVCYSQVQLEDVDEIIERHLLGGEPVTRLLTQEIASD
ncbi:MAG: (2Fe-2S) ferredoxin domain-containing protein [Bacteroidetes bacterium]|nr:MAG: (2Fe-2S) ferredoxin domain-containing protein [Bacteroidota bacterium]